MLCFPETSSLQRTIPSAPAAASLQPASSAAPAQLWTLCTTLCAGRLPPQTPLRPAAIHSSPLRLQPRGFPRRWYSVVVGGVVWRTLAATLPLYQFKWSNQFINFYLYVTKLSTEGVSFPSKLAICKGPWTHCSLDLGYVSIQGLHVLYLAASSQLKYFCLNSESRKHLQKIENKFPYWEKSATGKQTKMKKNLLTKLSYTRWDKDYGSLAAQSMTFKKKIDFPSGLKIFDSDSKLINRLVLIQGFG